MMLSPRLALALAAIVIPVEAWSLPPTAYHPALSIVHDPSFVPVAITGVGFGDGSTGELRLRLDSELLPPIPASARCASTTCSPSPEYGCIVYWTDDVVAAKLAPGHETAELQVFNGFEAASWVTAHPYRYDFFPTNEGPAKTTGANPVPQALVVRPDDPLRRVFFNEESHREFKLVDPTVGARKLTLQHPSTPPFFTSYLNPVTNEPAPMLSNTSQRNQDAIVDPLRRVWVNEGGWPVHQGVEGDYSRIAMYGYDDDAPESPSERRVYNLPGNATSTVSMAYQTSEGAPDRLWYANQDRLFDDQVIVPARIGWFEPESPELIHEGLREFSVAPCVDGICSDNAARACVADSDCAHTDQVCWYGEANPACQFHEYALPQIHTPGRMVVDQAGFPWVAAFWGYAAGNGNSALVRVDPLSPDNSWSYPLGNDPAAGPPVLLGSGPWDVELARNGDVLVSEYTDMTLNRFDVARAEDETCLTLVGGENPCVTSIQVPGDSLQYDGAANPQDPTSPPAQYYYRLHSLQPDERERTWFSTHGSFNLAADPTSRASVGYVEHDWSQALIFPPLTLFPFCSEAPACKPSPVFPGNFRAFFGGGIDVDSDTEDVWVSDYCRQRLGRLSPEYVNLARGGTATQSSTFCNSAGCHPAGKAIDGVVDGDLLGGGSVTHTWNDVHAFWELDLGGYYRVEEIEIWNRTDCCSDRLNVFYVFASLLPFSSSDPEALRSEPAVTTIEVPAVERKLVLPIRDNVRFLRVQLSGSEPLSLAEVVVLGDAEPVADCDSDGTVAALVPLMVLLRWRRRQVQRVCRSDVDAAAPGSRKTTGLLRCRPAHAGTDPGRDLRK